MYVRACVFVYVYVYLCVMCVYSTGLSGIVVALGIPFIQGHVTFHARSCLLEPSHLAGGLDLCPYGPSRLYNTPVMELEHN